MIKTKLEKVIKDTYLEALEDGRYIYLASRGSSMYPFIKNNDILTIESFAFGLEEGDIAIADIFPEEKMKFAAHRIVGMKKENDKIFYFIKGDSSNGPPEGPIPVEKIKGRVIEIKRGNLLFDFKKTFVKKMNVLVAYFSRKMPRLLIALKGIIDLLIEWPWIFKKIKRFAKKGGKPFLYNAEELLLTLSKSNFDRKAADKAIALIKEGLYWTRFCELTDEHLLAPLVYNSLRSIDENIRIPQFVKEELKKSYFNTTARNTVYYENEKNILRLLFDNSVPVISLKGTILSNRLYGDIAARGSSLDFDLLIREKDKEKAVFLLENAGYSYNPYNEVKKWQWQYLFNKSGAAMIDLHWDITMACRSKERIEGIWDGVKSIEQDRISCYALNDEELLLYLCAHLIASNEFRNLRYICDIDRLLFKCRYTIDWDSVITKSKRWRLSAVLYTALLLCRRLLNTSIPNRVVNIIKPSLPKRIFINYFANKRVILRRYRLNRLSLMVLRFLFFEVIESRTWAEYMSMVKRVMIQPEGPQFSAQKEVSKPVFIRYTQRLFRIILKLLNIKSAQP